MCKIKAVKESKGYVIKYCPDIRENVLQFIIEECLRCKIPVLTLDYTGCNLSNRKVNISIYYIVSMLNIINKIQTVFILLPDKFEPLFKGEFVIWKPIDDSKAKALRISDLKGVI